MSCWPTPCIQQYGALHQLYSFFWFYVAPVLLVVWSSSLLFRVFMSPYSWLIFFIVAIAESLVARWLAYLVTWVVRLMFVQVRLVTVALYSTVAWARFAKNSLMLTRLLSPYPPWSDVCCRYRRLAYASMKWAWKAV